jgi:transposase-like protein
MPLCNIIGLTPQGGTFYVAFGFLSDEREGSFHYILDYLTDLYIFLRLQPPAVVITDKDDALLNAVHNKWPSTASLICVWHINKNIFSHAKWAIRDYLIVQPISTASSASSLNNDKEFLKRIDDQ